MSALWYGPCSKCFPGSLLGLDSLPSLQIRCRKNRSGWSARSSELLTTTVRKGELRREQQGCTFCPPWDASVS